MKPEYFSRAARNSYAILSILVLFYHAGANDPDFLLDNIIGSSIFDLIRMPLYFFIGGLVLEKQTLRRTDLDLLKRRTKRLMIPFIWFAPLYYLIETSFSSSDYRRPNSLLFSILFPGYHLWFLPAFFLASLIGLMQIRYIPSPYFSAVFVYLTILVSMRISGEGDGIFASYALIELLPFLALGVLFSRTIFQSEIKVPNRFYILLVAFWLSLLFLEYPAISIFSTLFFLPVIFFAASFVKTGYLLRELSKYSIHIYLFSPLGIGLSRYMLDNYGSFGVTQEVFLNVFCGLTSAFLIVWAMKKTKLTSFLAGI
jgi:hypothetical protein